MAHHLRISRSLAESCGETGDLSAQFGGGRRVALWIGAESNSQCAWLFSRAFGGAETVRGVL